MRSTIDEVSKNHIIQEDMEYCANCKSFDVRKLKDKTVMVTGATGFIGRQTVLALLCMSRIHDLNIKVIAMVRNSAKAQNIFKDVISDENFLLLVQDITESVKTDLKTDYIIHCANPVNSKFFVEKPVETIDSIVTGTKNILEFAKNQKVSSVVYLSSMEVYGIIDIPIIKENDYGFIDPLNVRSSYSEGKRLAELMCYSYFKEYDVPVKTVRLSQVFGAGLDYDDSRVLSQFVRSVIEDKDIVLHTEGKSVLTNCYISDTINGILTVMLKGESGESYNLANPKNVFSIREIAQMLVDMGNNSKLVFDIGDTSKYRPDTILKLDTSKINSLGWHAQIGLREMMTRTISSYVEREKDE